jgi:phage gp46-like protein
MKHISEVLVEVIDNLLEQQPAAERPHCLQRQADLHDAMDDMGRYATEALTPAPARAFGGDL